MSRKLLIKPFRSIENTATASPHWQRRKFLQAGASSLILALISPRSVWAKTPSILAVRVWPAKDYTRVTIESDQPLNNSTKTLKNPDRLVVDLNGLSLDQTLRELVSKITPNDPQIQSVRVGQFEPHIVRLVFDLKGAVKPQVFSLKPISNYRYRLIFDLYPQVEPDLLEELIAQTEAKEQRLKEQTIAQHADESDRFFQQFEGNSIVVTNQQSINYPFHSPSKKKKPTRLLTIAIDPGHGGEDPGAIGPAGTYEKHIALSIAQILRAKIDADPNMRSMMTRNADFFVPLAVRVQKAMRVNADLFISIHADAFTTPAAKGSSVFALSQHGASSAQARWLAKKENSADLIGGLNLKTSDMTVSRALLDMSTTAQIRDSLRYGNFVLRQISNVNQLHGRQVEQAGFAVLKSPTIPSILVETAFISNPDEEKKLRHRGFQEKMASAIFSGIKQYFAANPPLARNV